MINFQRPNNELASSGFLSSLMNASFITASSNKLSTLWRQFRNKKDPSLDENPASNQVQGEKVNIKGKIPPEVAVLFDNLAENEKDYYIARVVKDDKERVLYMAKLESDYNTSRTDYESRYIAEGGDPNSKEHVAYLKEEENRHVRWLALNNAQYIFAREERHRENLNWRTAQDSGRREMWVLNNNLTTNMVACRNASSQNLTNKQLALQYQTTLNLFTDMSKNGVFNMAHTDQLSDLKKYLKHSDIARSNIPEFKSIQKGIDDCLRSECVRIADDNIDFLRKGSLRADFKSPEEQKTFCDQKLFFIKLALTTYEQNERHNPDAHTDSFSAQQKQRMEVISEVYASTIGYISLLDVAPETKAMLDSKIPELETMFKTLSEKAPQQPVVSTTNGMSI